MERPKAKQVRFSAEFDVSCGVKEIRKLSRSISKGKEAGQDKRRSSQQPAVDWSTSSLLASLPPFPETSRKSDSRLGRTTSLGSGDSWDAFDAKMLTAKTSPVERELLELSVNQNKSVHLEEEEFASMSFQDAQDLIEKDEQDRLQFMNSNLSFGEQPETGIDETEAPSLLSVTSYFQQGSSLPYPGGNESSMFGFSNSGLGFTPPSAVLDPKLASETLRRFSNNSNQFSFKDSLRRSSSAVGTKPTLNEDSSPDKSPGLARSDSLATFFLQPESQGLGKSGIMDYVLDYCKRRASFKNSEKTYTVKGTAEEDESDVEEVDSEQTVFSRGERDKTLTPVVEVKDKQKSSVPAIVVRPPSINEDKENSEKGPSRDSDIGNDEGFERFKRHLQTRLVTQDRYRKRMNNHLEFETKRFEMDERESHTSSPSKSGFTASTASTVVYSSGSGSDATRLLERPNRNACTSPPEKLVCEKKDKVGDVSNQSPFDTRATSTPRTIVNHSTPVNPGVLNRRVVPQNEVGEKEEVRKRKSPKSPEKDEAKKSDKKSQSQSAKTKDSGRSGSGRSSSNDMTEMIVQGPEVFSAAMTNSKERGFQIYQPFQGLLDRPRPHSVNALTGPKSPSITEKRVLQIKADQARKLMLPTPKPATGSGSNPNVLKPSNIMPPQTLPLAITPGCQAPHQIGNTPQCSCNQIQYQQPQIMGYGMPGMTPGMPIVIHIHLPQAGAMTPLPTPSEAFPFPPPK